MYAHPIYNIVAQNSRPTQAYMPGGKDRARKAGTYSKELNELTNRKRMGAERVIWALPRPARGDNPPLTPCYRALPGPVLAGSREKAQEHLFPVDRIIRGAYVKGFRGINPQKPRRV